MKKKDKTLVSGGELYKALVETSPDAITATDLEGKIIMVNKQTLRIHGFKTEKEILGRNAFDLIAPEDRRRAMENMQKTLKKGSIRSIDYTLLRKDGSRFFGDISASIVLDAEGKPKAFVGVTRDTTDRKRAEEALRESEERYRQLVELSPEGITVHRRGRILFSNTAGAKILGFKKPEQLIGKNIMDFVHSQSRQIVKERARKVVKGERVPIIEEKLLRADGKVVDAEVSAARMVYQGKPASQIIVRDITDRRKIIEELKSVKDHLQTILDSIEESIVVIDRKYRIVSHNKAFVKSLRRMKQRIVGEPCFRVIHGFMKPCRKCVVRNALKTGHPSHDVHYHLEREGKVYHEVKAYPLRDESGPINQCIYVFRDVTEREGMYEKIRETNIRLDELNKMKSDFVSITSHELRTPLAIIKGYVDVLSGGLLGDLNEKQKEKLDTISNKIKQLNNLIEKILDLSIIDSGGLKLNLQEVDLNDLALEVVKDFKQITKENEVEIQLKTDRTATKAVVDAERIKQVLVNLIINSIKFTPRLGIIRVIITKEPSYAVMMVEDTGTGIAKKNIDKLFDRFYQVDSTIRRKHGGVGLGLTICKRIVELHGGAVYIKSWVNKGTVVTVKLPT